MSTLRTTTISNLAGSLTVPTDTVVSGSAKAWVNFNGTGTVAIRSSFNVTSITDHAQGEYTVNFTSAMTDTNYAVSLALQPDRSTYPLATPVIYPSSNPTTGGIRIVTYYQDDNSNAVYYGPDAPIYCVIIYR
jgi:hypothetical protein